MRTVADFIIAANRVRTSGNLLKVEAVNEVTFWEDLEAYLESRGKEAPADLKIEIIETFKAKLINEIAPRCEQNGFETMNLYNIKWYIERVAKAMEEEKT